MEAFAGKPEYKERLDQATHGRDRFEEIKTQFETDVAEWLRKREAKEKTGAHPTPGRIP